MTAAMKTALACAILLMSLTGCATTTTSVNAGGSNRGAGGSASVSTGIKF